MLTRYRDQDNTTLAVCQLLCLSSSNVVACLYRYSLILVLCFIMLTLFIAPMYYITAYEAGHSLDNRTLTIKYHVLFNDLPQFSTRPITVQLSVIDLTILFLCLVHRL